MQDDAASRVTFWVDGREVTSYRWDDPLPHLWPVRSPSGKELTVQHPDPYPHHRSLWIADRAQLLGEDGGAVTPDVDFYHCFKNRIDPDDASKGHRHAIRHVAVTASAADADHAAVICALQWDAAGTVVLDETRTMRVVALAAASGSGASRDVLVELEWTLTASHGDVRFASDWVHYAWPYVRVHPQFSGQRGGAIVDDRGRRGQKATNAQFARWVDVSNTVDGVTEGIAVFPWPATGAEAGAEGCKWLTREYGTFGPRRAEALSGTRFVLPRGETLHGHCAVLLHAGDAESGEVAARYADYVESKR